MCVRERSQAFDVHEWSVCVSVSCGAFLSESDRQVKRFLSQMIH